MPDRPTPAIWPAFVTVAAVALLPFLELVAGNLGETLRPFRILLYASVTVVLGLGIVALFRRSPHGVRRAAVIVAALLWMFFHLPTIRGWWDGVGLDAPPLVEWIAATAIVGLVVLPLSRSTGVQTWAAVVAPVLLVLPVVQIAGHVLTGGTAIAPESQGLALEAVDRPSVYFFVVDGYDRADVMEEMTGLDITPFLAELEQRGFVVSDRANANYPTTFLSLASTLSMDYLVDETDQVTRYRQFYERLQGDNVVVETFRTLGYRYVHAYPGIWDGTACPTDADRCFGDSDMLTETDWAILRRTPIGPPLATATMIDRWALHSDPSHVVDQLLADRPDVPYFMFSHVMAPHPPFVRRADCSVRHDVVIDISRWPDPDEYADFVTCLNGQLREAFDRILEVDPDAVIILQADHGSGFTWAVPERMPILSAMRVPEPCRAAVPSDLGAVNTFRIVFDCLTTTDFELLPNRSFNLNYEDPDVRDVTAEVWGGE